MLFIKKLQLNTDAYSLACKFPSIFFVSSKIFYIFATSFDNPLRVMRAVIYSEKGVFERLSLCVKNIDAGTD